MVKAHATVFNVFIKEHKLFSSLIVLFLLYSADLCFKITPLFTEVPIPEISILIFVLYMLAIFLVWGHGIVKKTEIADEMIDYVSQANRKLTDEQKDFLSVGATSRSYFHISTIFMLFFGLSNLYLHNLMPQTISYFLFDLSYFLVFLLFLLTWP